MFFENFLDSLTPERLSEILFERATLCMAGPDDTHIAMIDISPWLARVILHFNNGNRKMRPAHVGAYASNMTSGQWKFAGDPIRICIDGTLLDGQHRLQAIAEQPDDFKLTNLVIWNMPADTQLVMDQGAKRSPADQLNLMGYRDAHNTAAAARWIILYDTGMIFRSSVKWEAFTTSAHIVAWVEDHDQEIDFMQDCTKYSRRSLMAPGPSLAAYTILSRLDSVAALNFAMRVADGAGLMPGDPILALRNRAIKNRAAQDKETPRDTIGLIIRVWNAWVQGQSLSRIQMPNGGTFNRENFPVPIQP